MSEECQCGSANVTVGADEAKAFSAALLRAAKVDRKPRSLRKLAAIAGAGGFTINRNDRDIASVR